MMLESKHIPPVHPGEVLNEEFLKPMGIGQYRLAKEMNVYPRKINEIVHGKRSITADTALRLARFFGASAELWMNFQALYDLEATRDKIDERVMLEVRPRPRDERLATLRPFQETDSLKNMKKAVSNSRVDNQSGGKCFPGVALQLRGDRTEDSSSDPLKKVHRRERKGHREKTRTLAPKSL